jgi:small-conductance mechanosensitive channel
MSVLLFLIFIAVFGLFGLLYWAGSALPLVIREVALNTRKEGEGGTQYRSLDVLSVCLKVLAVVIWVIGLIMAIASLVAGGNISQLLMG